MKNLLVFSTLFISLFAIKPAEAFTSSFQFELFSGFNLSEGRTSGHEEITRQALVNTKELLKKNGSKVDIARGGIKLLHDLEFSKRGLIGALAKNPIIKGVYCSDFPENKQCLFSLSEFWFKNEPDIDWHTGNTTQTLHFLRDYKESGGLVSPYQACVDSRKRISIASITAAIEWQKGNIDNALFLIGHAAHIIQDSFSHAHVKRDNIVNGFKIKDICYYGDDKKQELSFIKKEFMACYHPSLESTDFDEAIIGDSIWIRTQNQLRTTKLNYRGEDIALCPMTTHQYILSEESKISCMNLEARLGRDATVKYLYLIASEFYKNRGVKYDHNKLVDFAKTINEKLFDGTFTINGFVDRTPNGIAQCAHLSKTSI